MLIFHLVAGRQAGCILYLFYHELLVPVRRVTKQGFPQPPSCPAVVISHEMIETPPRQVILSADQ